MDNIYSSYPRIKIRLLFPNYVVSIKHLLNLVSLMTSLFSDCRIIFYGCSDNNALEAELFYITFIT